MPARQLSAAGPDGGRGTGATSFRRWRWRRSCAQDGRGAGRKPRASRLCSRHRPRAGSARHSLGRLRASDDCRRGFEGIGGLRRLRNLFLVLPRSAIETALVLRKVRPHVVVGVGGYAAGPAMLEAAVVRIPTLLIEPNAVPGFTNRVLAPVVRLAAVGFEEAARVYGARARITGHPVRRAFALVPPKAHVPPYTLLILGAVRGGSHQPMRAREPAVTDGEVWTTENAPPIRRTGL